MSTATLTALGAGALIYSGQAVTSEPLSDHQVTNSKVASGTRSIDPSATHIELAAAIEQSPLWRLNCGYVTCSIYYSRRVTQQMGANWLPDKDTVNRVSDSGAGTACTAAGGAAVGFACIVVSIAATTQFWDALRTAYDTNNCLRIRYVPGPGGFTGTIAEGEEVTKEEGIPVGIPVKAYSDNNGSYCG